MDKETSKEEILFYYLRNGSKPYGCVAIKENDDGTVSRGVSLCSMDDNFDKKRARSIALARLAMAESTKKDCQFKIYFGKYSNMKFPECNCTIDKYSWHNFPTAKEYRMFHNPSAQAAEKDLIEHE